jgi:hypothetical protein
MKAHITTIVAVAMLGCGAAFAAGSAQQARNASAAATCAHQTLGKAGRQHVNSCRAGQSRVYMAFNENRHATDADLGG